MRLDCLLCRRQKVMIAVPQPISSNRHDAGPPSHDQQGDRARLTAADVLF